MSDDSLVRKAPRRSCTLPALVLQQLSKLQDGLNRFIDIDWLNKRCADEWGLAITMEASELMDSYPWKWWKNINAKPDFDNVKIELVDILHFSLSGTMQMTHKCPQHSLSGFPSDLKREIVTPLTETSNAIATFRNIIYLTKYHRFDTITEQVIAAAEDLEFNLVAYYVAKHTLNYIRQLGGYKKGDYQKVQKGIEDNELLHAAICGFSVQDVIDQDTYQHAWNSIMEKTYEAFGVPAEQRRCVEDWLGTAGSIATETMKVPTDPNDVKA